jgi:hypothetical protein
MKKLSVLSSSLVAGLALLMAVPALSDDDHRRDDRGRDYDRRDDRGRDYDRRDYGRRRDYDRRDYGRRRDYDRRDYGRRDDRRRDYDRRDYGRRDDRGRDYGHGRRGGFFRGDRGGHRYRPHAPVVVRPWHNRYHRRPDFRFDVILSDLFRTNQAFEIGSTYLSNAGDFDVIPVRECGLRAVQIYTKRADAYIDYIVVNTADGNSIELDRNEYYDAESFSNWVDLPGFTSCVTDVVVVGRTVSSAFSQAEVEVIGRR